MDYFSIMGLVFSNTQNLPLQGTYFLFKRLRNTDDFFFSLQFRNESGITGIDFTISLDVLFATVSHKVFWIKTKKTSATIDSDKSY